MTPVKDHILYHLIEFYLLKGMISVKLVFHSYGYMFPFSFLQTAEPDYRRLTLSQPVGLKHTGYVITVNNVIKVRGERRNDGHNVIIKQSDDGQVTQVNVNCIKASETDKPKAFVHWVSSPLTCDIRLYDKLYAVN